MNEESYNALRSIQQEERLEARDTNYYEHNQGE